MRLREVFTICSRKLRFTEFLARRLESWDLGKSQKRYTERRLALDSEYCDRRLGRSELANHEVEAVSLQELLRSSDFISIHVPLTPDTRHILNLDAFRQMKSTACIINTSRGEVIDADALLTALNEGLIAGAGLDVLAKEPPDPCDPLILHPRTIITPHAAFNSEESLEELQETAAKQMADVLSGRLPPFVVNPEVLTQPNLRAALAGVKPLGAQIFAPFG
jgi:D-3-phosphoglycerate dehydrogenase